AILIYLAEKTGKLLPTDLRGRKEVLEWVMWQMGGLGPMLGQSGHFKFYAPEKIPYAMERYETEMLRLYGVLNRRLEGREFIAGDFSIADIACWPWIITYKRQEVDLDRFPNVKRWYKALQQRPALRRGYAVGSEFGKPDGNRDAEAVKNLTPRA
ncbi:MAG: glutathione binding-like protein, partial [Alphaproteobacteria bacterium]